MDTDHDLIKDIQKIRSNSNFNTMAFLKLLFKLNIKKAKNCLDKIQKGDKEVQILSDLLHMEKTKTDLEILNEIESIRAKNNTLWMDVVRMCFELDPPRARKLFSQIKECDRNIHMLSEKISNQ